MNHADQDPAAQAHAQDAFSKEPESGQRDRNAPATLRDVDIAIARHLAPMREKITRLQRQIAVLGLGPDPW